MHKIIWLGRRPMAASAFALVASDSLARGPIEPARTMPGSQAERRQCSIAGTRRSRSRDRAERFGGNGKRLRRRRGNNASIHSPRQWKRYGSSNAAPRKKWICSRDRNHRSCRPRRDNKQGSEESRQLAELLLLQGHGAPHTKKNCEFRKKRRPRGRRSNSRRQESQHWHSSWLSNRH